MLPAPELHLVVRKRASTPALSSGPQQPASRHRHLGSQLLSLATHLGPRAVTGENKPSSKAKLAKNPSGSPQGLSSVNLNYTQVLQWKGGERVDEKKKKGKTNTKCTTTEKHTTEIAKRSQK